MGFVESTPYMDNQMDNSTDNEMGTTVQGLGRRSCVNGVVVGIYQGYRHVFRV